MNHLNKLIIDDMKPLYYFNIKPSKEIDLNLNYPEENSTYDEFV
jgi:hypothetical protein